MNQSATTRTNRLPFLDALRGFALVGVLIANFHSYTDQQVPEKILAEISSPTDLVLTRINAVFIEWKFMTLFSILFGYSFGLILESLRRSTDQWKSVFIRRMIVLFAIGTLHTLLWWADVLHIYALCGLLLFAFHKTSDRGLIVFSVVFLFLLPLAMELLNVIGPESMSDSDFQYLFEQFKYGGLTELVQANLLTYYKLFIVNGSELTFVFETLGKFLIGYYLFRIGLFEQVEIKRTYFRKAMLTTAPAMILYFAIRLMMLDHTVTLHGPFWELINKAGILCTSFFYASALAMTYIAFGNTVVFRRLQELGRMTATNYLLVSAIMIFYLYGVGLGRLGEIPIHQIWGLAIVWLAVEILFSNYWLSRFRFGPVEWIWRQLAWGKVIPLRKINS